MHIFGRSGVLNLLAKNDYFHILVHNSITIEGFVNNVASAYARPYLTTDIELIPRVHMFLFVTSNFSITVRYWETFTPSTGIPTFWLK
jgi:hypothetical protein